MKWVAIILLALISGFISTGYAYKAMVVGKIESTLSNNGDAHGGCMIFLDEVLADYALDCPGSGVSFSCTGDFSPKDAAYSMFDSAKLGFALEKDVVVFVDDSKKHNNGYCFAYRIDLLR